MNDSNLVLRSDSAHQSVANRLFYYRKVEQDELSWIGNCETLLGYATEELPRTITSWLSLIHPEDRPSVEHLLRQTNPSSSAVKISYRVRTKNGDCRLVKDESAFLTEGELVGAIAPAKSSPSMEELFQMYTLSMPTGILITDCHGEITYANASVHTCFGYQPGELLGKPVEVLLPEEIRARHVRFRKDFLRNPEQRVMAGRELLGIRKDGKEVQIAVGLNPLQVGETTKVVCTILDLTYLKRAERDLVRFFDLSLDLFCIANFAGYFLRVNSNFSRVLGYQESELLSRPFLDFVHPEDVQATIAALEQANAGQPVVQFHNRYRATSGAYRWLEWNSRSIPEEQTIFAVARDVTERVEMERELQAREERERAILDNTAAVVYVKGVDGKYQYVNQRHADLFSLNRMAVIGKTEHEIFPPPIADVFEKNDRRVMETRETMTMQETAPHDDGVHTYISVKFPLFDGAGNVTAVAGISTDITDQLKVREADEQFRLARVFQQKLYPARPPMIPGLDLAGSVLPVWQVCGDYFDYIQRSPKCVAVSLGDVSGHGFGPALQMVEVRATLRILMKENANLDRVAEELNRILCVDLPESSFVSLFLAEIDAEKQELRYVGAGHQALLFKRNGTMTVLQSTGPLLGIDDTATFEHPNAIPLEEKDLLVLFTDGLTEATNINGDQFGTNRLVQNIQENQNEPTKVILERLFSSIYDFARGRTIHDDMTAIAVKMVGFAGQEGGK